MPSVRPHQPVLRALTPAAVVALSLALGVTACSNGSSDDSGDTITVGIPVANTASLAQAGVSAPDAASADDIETMYKAALKSVTGYKIDTKFVSFNLVQTGAPQTTCLKLLQDEKADVVLASQFVNGGDQCVVQRGGTLIQSIAVPQAAYGMKQGVVYTNDQMPNDAATNFATYLTTQAHLESQTIGVLTDALGGDATPVNDILVPALKKAGLHVAHVSTLSADITQVAQQVPVEVAQMRDAGVTAIVDATPSANLMQFLGGMTKAGWKVPFIAGDLNNAIDESFAAAYPKTFEATGYTARRFTTDNAAATTCYQNYVAAGGKELTPNSASYQANLEVCDQVKILSAGLSKLGGKAFDKKAFSEALSQGGDLDFAYFGAGSLSGASSSTARKLHTVTFTNGHWSGTDENWTAISHG